MQNLPGRSSVIVARSGVVEGGGVQARVDLTEEVARSVEGGGVDLGEEVPDEPPSSVSSGSIVVSIRWYSTNNNKTLFIEHLSCKRMQLKVLYSKYVRNNVHKEITCT